METLLDLFEHDGWKLFIEEKENLLKSLKESAYIDCPENDTWQQRRAIIATLSSIVSYEDSVKFIVEQDSSTEGTDEL